MTNATPGNPKDIVDVGRLIDQGKWSGYQKWVVLLTALGVVVDGLDNRLLPLAISPLLKEWHLSRDAFALATSVGLMGMAVGTMAGGILGDRIGRRPTIIGSLLVFGVVTLANAFANDIAGLTILRFVAGLGLGALMPASAAMAAEFAPADRRTFAVTLGMVCIPIGGTLSGIIGAAVLPVPGWRMLFVIGGLSALVLALAHLAWLPESPRYLIRDRRHHAALRALLARIGHAVGENSELVEKSADARTAGSLSHLFAAGLRRDTIGLWGAFFAILLCLYMESQWMPAVLSAAGYDLKTASIAGSCLAFGGIFACVIGVAAVHYLGSRWSLMGMAAAGFFLTLGLSQYPVDPARSAVPLLVLLTGAGFLIGGLQIMIYVIAAHVYPPHVRSTGIGWAVGVGRLGSVLSPFVAAWGLSFGGWSAFFCLLAVALAATFAFLGMIRRHVPPRPARIGAGSGGADPGAAR